MLADLVEVERALGDEDRVGAAGHPRVDRDPAGVAAHDLDDDHAVVRLGRRVQAVDRVGRDLHRGVEAERVVGAVEVVVDRLRHADDGHAVGRQAARDAERVLAADRDQRVDAGALHRLAHERRAVRAVLVGVRARGAEDRAAARQDALRLLERQLEAVALEHAGPAVAKAGEDVAVAPIALADRAADHGVEAGAVAAAGQQADAHPRDVVMPPSATRGRSCDSTHRPAERLAPPEATTASEPSAPISIAIGSPISPTKRPRLVVPAPREQPRGAAMLDDARGVPASLRVAEQERVAAPGRTARAGRGAGEDVRAALGRDTGTGVSRAALWSCSVALNSTRHAPPSANELRDLELAQITRRRERRADLPGDEVVRRRMPDHAAGRRSGPVLARAHDEDVEAAARRVPEQPRIAPVLLVDPGPERLVPARVGLHDRAVALPRDEVLRRGAADPLDRAVLGARDARCRASPSRGRGA